MRRYLDQRLKLQLLRGADALGTHRSLLKASAVLGIGQPPLSRSLQEMEGIVGQRLSERHSDIAAGLAAMPDPDSRPRRSDRTRPARPG